MSPVTDGRGLRRTGKTRSGETFDIANETLESTPLRSPCLEHSAVGGYWEDLRCQTASEHYPDQTDCVSDVDALKMTRIVWKRLKMRSEQYLQDNTESHDWIDEDPVSSEWPASTALTIASPNSEFEIAG